ncbi:hypothetical protein [Neisseria bacilliformis]|uniref:hypothetical protein n=1 Tax=Neisseria bacilliformis TaxID=267212 RepID=UPI000665FCE8|nr:hypothetical protein [Neisseria bacilliformis]
MSGKTILSATVRELETGWECASIGRIVKTDRRYAMLDLAGREIARGSLETAAAAGRALAEQQGWLHGCSYQ